MRSTDEQSCSVFLERSVQFHKPLGPLQMEYYDPMSKIFTSIIEHLSKCHKLFSVQMRLIGEGFILLTRGYGFMGGGCTTAF